MNKSDVRKYLLFLNRRFIELSILFIICWAGCGPGTIHPDTQVENQNIQSAATLADMKNECLSIEKHFEIATGNSFATRAFFFLYLLGALGLSVANMYLAKRLTPEDSLSKSEIGGHSSDKSN